MITKQEIKNYAQLKQKKYRDSEKKFFVEGLRVLREAVKSDYVCEYILMTEDCYNKKNDELAAYISNKTPWAIISPRDFESLSDTKTPQGIGGVFKMKESSVISHPDKILYFDTISDPGNAGTLIRSAGWFGFSQIIFSADSVECYNPKLIRSAAGIYFFCDILRDEIDLSLLDKLKADGYLVLGSDMEGINYKEIDAEQKKIVLVVSNEATGLSYRAENIIDKKITIPGSGIAESLNVAVAGSILMSHFGSINR